MMRCLKKITIESKSGSGASKLPTCQFYEQLLFMKDSISNNKSTSSKLTLSMPAAPGGIDITNSGDMFDESFEINASSLENDSSFKKHKVIGNPMETPCAKKAMYIAESR